MMHVAGIKPMVWIPIVTVLLSGLIGWGAWATVTTTSATPRAVFDRHVDRADEKFDMMQRTIDNKVQKIYDHLLGEDDG